MLFFCLSLLFTNTMDLQQIIAEEYYNIIKEQKFREVLPIDPQLDRFDSLHKQYLWPKKFKYGYSFGKLGEDPMDERGGDKFRYGASMNKPILAFINQVLAKEGAINTRSGNKIRKLNDDELNRMIAYTRGSGWSNRVNRAASNMSRVRGKDPWGHEKREKWDNKSYYDKHSAEVGVSKKQAQEVLNRLGLSDTIKGVHWGGANNQQSTRGYSKFMSLLNQMKSDPNHEYHDEATRVLSFVNKRQGGTGARGLKKYLNKKLENAGYGKNAIQSIYGKGGYVKGTLNYSVVINDKYVLSLYSKMPGQSAGTIRPNLNKIAFNTITKNLTPKELGVVSPERQQQDLEVDAWNAREAERAAAIADVDVYTDMPGQEADWWAPEEFDKELDLKTIEKEKLPPTRFDWDSIQKLEEDIGLSLKHPVNKGYKLTDEEYSNLDDIDKLGLLAAEEEASKTIPFPRKRTSSTPSKYSYGDTASPTYFKSPEFYEYEDSMRAIRGEPTREESERNEKLIDVVDAMTRDVVKDFQDPQSRAMEEWLSLEDLKNLTDFATRDSGVSKEEAWSALQSEYPELFGAPGKSIGLTKTFIDYLEKIYGPQDKEGDKELDFREKDVFGRSLPIEEEPPVYTLPVPRGSQLSENRILKRIEEENNKLIQEAVTPLIKVDMVLKYERDFSFYGNVLNQIRSIKGIAIAKASDVGVVDIGPDKRMVLMHLKFMPDRPLHQYLTYLQIELKKIKDKDGDRIIATQIKGIPREVEI
jgi:hypothetical protein